MRNNSLDTFRLFAALAVIMLHVGYGNLPAAAENIIRLLARFAVPFFFLISGYFFYENFQKNGDTYFTKTIQRLLGIFVIACLVNMLIKFQKLSFSFSLLYEGTNYHLWFLSSMIFGLIICWYHYSYLQSKYIMIFVSVSIILLSLLSDSYSIISPYKLDGNFCRYLLSVPYLYFGSLIAQNKYKLSNTISILLIITGIFLQIGETCFLQRYYGSSTFSNQFLAGTIPFSFGMFFLSFNGYSNNLLAEMGRKYSLSIYVYHLFVNFFLFKAIKFIFKEHAGDVFIFSPLISFAFTLYFLVAINKYLPALFAILNGELKTISGLTGSGKVYKIPQ